LNDEPAVIVLVPVCEDVSVSGVGDPAVDPADDPALPL
jgi:hypothetical protein